MEINRIGCCENTNGINLKNVTKEDIKEIISTKEFAENCKKGKHQEAVAKVQEEFLSQIREGKSPREAFFDSLSAMNKKSDKNGDKYEKTIADRTEKFSITPEKIKPWLELISFAVPIIKSIIDLIAPKKADNE